MRILMLSGYCHLDGVDGFERSTSGFGYTVGAITKELAKKPENEVWLLTQSAFVDEQDIASLHIVRKHWAEILKSFSFRYLSLWLRDMRGTPLFSAGRLRALAYYLTGRYAEKVIREIRPDIVNIHGIGATTLPFIYACRRTNVPFVVSLHGLNSFHQQTASNTVGNRAERWLLRQAAEGNLWLTVISSGIRQRILSAFEPTGTTHIEVVPNGKDIVLPKADAQNKWSRKSLGWSEEDKVILCCSSLTKNKNQIQLLRAVCLMPEELRKQTRVLLIGNGPERASLECFVKDNRMEEHVAFTGQISAPEVFACYSLADVNVLVSFSEGFGNSFVEGFSVGLPSVTFPDLDAVEDLYAPFAMVSAADRSDAALAEALEQALRTDWDREKIIAHGARFCVRRMIDGYQEVFQSCTQEQGHT